MHTTLRVYVGKTDFLEHNLKILSLVIKKIVYNMGILRQTACMAVNLMIVDNFAHLFNCPTMDCSCD